MSILQNSFFLSEKPASACHLCGEHSLKQSQQQSWVPALVRVPSVNVYTGSVKRKKT